MCSGFEIYDIANFSGTIYSINSGPCIRDVKYLCGMYSSIAEDSRTACDYRHGLGGYQNS